MQAIDVFFQGHQINLCSNVVYCVQELFLNNDLTQAHKILAWINLLIPLKVIPLASLKHVPSQMIRFQIPNLIPFGHEKYYDLIVM